MSDSGSLFDQKAYLTKKRREKWQGWGGTILGSVTLLSSGSPFPIPLIGIPSVIVGAMLLFWGISQFKSYQKLPLHETVAIARQNEGRFTRTDLFLALQLSSEQVDAVIQTLIEQGFIEADISELPPEHETTYRLIT